MHQYNGNPVRAALEQGGLGCLVLSPHSED